MNANILKRAAERYEIPVSMLKPSAGGNFSHVYKFSRDGQAFILKITPPNDEIDAQSMRAILEWVFYLASHGAPVASPILSRDGHLIETIEDDGESYLAVLFEKAPGILAEELPVDAWDETLVQNLGRAAGKMHAVARSYVTASRLLKRPDWDQVANCYNPSEELEPSQKGVLEKRSEVLEAVRELPKDADGYGLIHADFHGANFFVEPQSKAITVFDFDDCCHGWYAMDIAMSLFDILVLYTGEERQRFASWFLENYLLGYIRENRLTPFWIDQLPLFLKLLETGIYVAVYRFAEDSRPDSWVGKFMPGRKERIETDVAYVDIDFAGIYKQAWLG